MMGIVGQIPLSQQGGNLLRIKAVPGANGRMTSQQAEQVVQ
jgi:hypothetical protein